MQISFDGDYIASLPPQGQQVLNNNQPVYTPTWRTPFRVGSMKSIFTGTTSFFDSTRVREFTERQSASYNGDTYHLTENCNHSCKDICYKLTGKSISTWVNQLARPGSIESCMLPEALRAWSWLLASRQWKEKATK